MASLKSSTPAPTLPSPTAAMSSSSPPPTPMDRFKHSLTSPTVSSFIAGGVAGGLSRTIVSPLERLKILYQVQDKGKTEYKMSIPKALLKIWREEGFRGYLRGNGSNCVRIVPYSAIQFATYAKLKNLMATDDTRWLPLVNLTCGAMAGVTSVTCTYPLDIVRTRLSIQSASFNSLQHAQSRKLPGMWTSLVTMYRTEGGVRALYRGIIPTIAGVGPYIGASWTCYEAIREWFTKPGEDGPRGPQKLMAGGLSGAIAQTITYPFDVLRRRFQVNTMEGMGYRYTSISSAIRQIFREQGIRGFYLGLGPNLLKAIPAISVSYYSFETVREWVKEAGRS